MRTRLQIIVGTPICGNPSLRTRAELCRRHSDHGVECEGSDLPKPGPVKARVVNFDETTGTQLCIQVEFSGEKTCVTKATPTLVPWREWRGNSLCMQMGSAEGEAAIGVSTLNVLRARFPVALQPIDIYIEGRKSMSSRGAMSGHQKYSSCCAFLLNRNFSRSRSIRTKCKSIFRRVTRLTKFVTTSLQAPWRKHKIVTTMEMPQSRKPKPPRRQQRRILAPLTGRRHGRSRWPLEAQ